jgi:uncharacterized protein (DUF2147 family)
MRRSWQSSWQRFCYLAILMALSSSAHAGNSFSFTVGGHHIQIEAPKNCDSPSCVSVSIPGIYQRGRRRVRNDDDDNRNARQTVAIPVAPPAPAQVCAPPAASKPLAETVASIPAPATTAPAVAPIAAPAVVRPAAPVAQQVAVPPPSPAQPAQPVAAATPTVAPLPAAPPPAPIALPAPEIAPRVSRVSHEEEDEPTDSPLGDWQTEGNKGSVRIERCGEALCGFVLNLASNTKGETILIDMKPKAASKATSQWSGNIYSRDSGNTYYATIAMKGVNSLQVQACALGHFFCSANVWSRIDIKPVRPITGRSIVSKT